MRINDHYLKLQSGYLFPEIARRVSAFSTLHPDAALIKLGIGDVTEPLPAAAIEAMHRAVDEMGCAETFRGYGPEQGYAFLREKIVACEYHTRGCDIDAEEIFISDGSKCDCGNFLDVVSPHNTIAVLDPVYPVYVDTNVMAGHTGPANDAGEYEGLVYLTANADNGFAPPLPSGHVDIIYLCYPNNPTGAVATTATLEGWVAYAREHDALILFDAAYEAYITEPDIPHSIYEIAGARAVAVEFRSFSKMGGFTGTRCAYTVVPKSVKATAGKGGEPVQLHSLWNRRQTTKFNGVSYIVQRGAEALYSNAGQRQVRQLVEFYMANAAIMRQTLTELGLDVFGGINAPYLWLKTPDGLDSWSFFDKLLAQNHIVGTPGSGFGAAGEGYFRLSAFNNRQNVEEAMRRTRKSLPAP